jgi:murein L,D-transpeptidase YcbB/YkuD
MKLKTLLCCAAILIALTGYRPAYIPASENYRKLERALNYLSRSEWPLPGEVPVLKQTDKNNAVLKIKKYLKATGDLRGNRTYMASPVFDERLAKAVGSFQERHGLKADGIVGRNTLEKMNVSLDYRIKQLAANLERMKMLPGDFGERFIIVNIPAFYLEYYERGRMQTRMNVVVGDIENYTPVMQDTMSYIVFNPSWNVPVKIATKEIIPEAQTDPGYFDKNNYSVLKGSYTSKDTIDPKTVSWQDFPEENFPFSIVQKPGPDNALGRVKFVFPNKLDIYLHDTPSNQAFRLERRDLSHGCIRLEKPLELAGILLAGQMDQEEIDEIIKSEETKAVKLDKKVVVHLLYQTAWIDNEGRLQLRDDIYELDKLAIQQ